MVERLKAAIEKARAQRAATTGAGDAAPPPPSAGRGALWATLQRVEPRRDRLLDERIVAFDRTDPAYVPFDVLRTQLRTTCQANGWRRILVTSPTKGCGKSMVSANMAFAYARQESLRTVLMDLDLKAPRLAHLFDMRDTCALGDVLQNAAPPLTCLRSVSENLAVAFNSTPVRNSAEVFQNPATAIALDRIIDGLQPDIAIFDSSPMLISDDVLALLPHVDCLLMVAGAGDTKARELLACEQMLPPETNFLGVVLNKSREQSGEYGAYAYA